MIWISKLSLAGYPFQENAISESTLLLTHFWESISISRPFWDHALFVVVVVIVVPKSIANIAMIEMLILISNPDSIFSQIE